MVAKLVMLICCLLQNVHSYLLSVSSTFAISFRLKRAVIVPERPSLWKSTWYHSPSLTFLSMALVLVVPEPMSSSKYRCPSSISIAKKSTCRLTRDRCKKPQTGTFVQAVKMQITVAGVTWVQFVQFTSFWILINKLSNQFLEVRTFVCLKS